MPHTSIPTHPPSSISTFAVSSNAHPILDAVLAGSLIVHTHIGFDACIIDYVHTRKFPIAGKVANWGLRAATLGALWGAYEFNTNDVGASGARGARRPGPPWWRAED